MLPDPCVPAADLVVPADVLWPLFESLTEAVDLPRCPPESARVGDVGGEAAALGCVGTATRAPAPLPVAPGFPFAVPITDEVGGSTTVGASADERPERDAPALAGVTLRESACARRIAPVGTTRRAIGPSAAIWAEHGCPSSASPAQLARRLPSAAGCGSAGEEVCA